MGYDQYTVPNTVAVKLTFVASRAIFAISLKNSELKTTTIPFGIRQPFSK